VNNKICIIGPEEIAFMKGFIDAAQVEKLANQLLKSSYGLYLMSLPKQDRIN
jgi:glucose-1-phosphate thymidylyltransferase